MINTLKLNGPDAGLNKIKWLGLLVFGLLGIASVIYYRERVIYVDSAYYAFNLFNDNFPAAEHARYALYLYQLIPWLLFNLGASFKVLLISYSLSHALLHAIAFFFLIKMKQARLALLLLLMQILTYRECFFLSVNETALAMSAVLLIAGYLSYREQNQGSYLKDFILLLICSSIAFLSHPMAMILLPFVYGYHILQFNKIKDWKFIIKIMVPVFIGFLIKKFLSKGSGYEDDLFNQLKSAGTIITHLSNYYSFDFFFGRFKLESYFFRIYIIPLLLMIVIIYRLVSKKEYRVLGYYLLANIGFLLLIMVLFNRGDGNIFMEKNFTPWVMVAIYPIVYFSDPAKLSNTVIFITVILLIYAWQGVMHVQPMDTKRLYLMDRLITEKNPTKANKLLIQDSTVNHDEWLGIWGLPYETILLSKVKNMPVTTAKIYHNEDHINKELYRKDIFIGADFIPVLTTNYMLRYNGFKMPDQLYVKIENP